MLATKLGGLGYNKINDLYLYIISAQNMVPSPVRLQNLHKTYCFNSLPFKVPLYIECDCFFPYKPLWLIGN